MSQEKHSPDVAFYWLVVGYVSPLARKWVEEHGGMVTELHSEKIPQLYAVALAYSVEGYWSWSHGRQEHRSGLEFFGDDEIDVHAVNDEQIHLGYGSTEPNLAPAYSSAVNTYLIVLGDEEFDPRTGKVKERVEDSQIEEWVIPTPKPFVPSPQDDWDPFLDADDLP